MLRLYKQIEKDNIFKLHKILKYLIFNIWCKADDEEWKDKANNKKLFKLLHYSVKTGVTFENEIERIYNIFKTLTNEEKARIKRSWKINNDIEKLCTKKLKPIYLSDLPEVVRNDIKPLFSWCYTYLLNQKEASGDKLDYYKKLISLNEFEVCPCCGMIDFELDDSKYREAYDHYLPKSEYPFSSINFKNLVPICYKCNSDRKGTKNPIENKRVAFYPFSNSKNHEISIEFKIDKTKDLNKLTKEDIKIVYKGKDKEIETWDWLFDISKRYNNKVKKYSESMLKRIKNRHKIHLSLNKDITYQETIDLMINEYKEERYTDKNFLRIPLLEVIKNRQDIISVYNKQTTVE
ncbi:hypothetical protein [Arcobacter sp.]|uniref:hypothetical protein n=1 Tax=Arcobacter sp. TaxID=1872629 RepID=UPI003C7505EA